MQHIFSHQKKHIITLKTKDLSIGISKRDSYEDTAKNRPAFTRYNYAHLFYHNWLNIVYQETPYCLEDIGRGKFCVR